MDHGLIFGFIGMCRTAFGHATTASRSNIGHASMLDFIVS
jgi:hypothetical protein